MDQSFIVQEGAQAEAVVSHWMNQRPEFCSSRVCANFEWFNEFHDFNL